MALGTLRGNKMRSALTVLGVVIGVTSIVGMTSLIRGFDTSLRDSINALGPKTIFVQRFGGLSFASGASFMQLMRRPVLTVDDGEAIRRLATTVQIVDTWLGAAPPQPTQQRLFYRGERTRPNQVIGTTERFVDVNFAKLFAGRIFTEQEVHPPAQCRGHRLRSVSGALRQPQHRSDRQDRAHRRRRVHDRRRHRQAAGSRRLQPRPGRLRDHPVHRAPPAVRFREDAQRAVRRHRRHDRHRPARVRDARRDDARGREHHAHPPRPDARQAERLRSRHLRRDPRGVGSDLAARSCCRSSSSRRSR